MCCGHHVCPSCQRGRWGTVELQRSEMVRNWARFQLQWGLVRLNRERCLAEVGGAHPGAGGAEGGEGCFLGTMLFLLESQNAFWKADVSCVKTELPCSGSLWLSPPCWWQCRNEGCNKGLFSLAKPVLRWRCPPHSLPSACGYVALQSCCVRDCASDTEP